MNQTLNQLPKIAVVILNWNGRKFLDRFLPSVVAYSSEADIYVADNASTDDSVMFVRKNFPQIQIIQNPDNGGFCKGYNLALRQIKADYYVLLNSDVEVTPDWLHAPILLMEAQAEIAVCQPKILSFKNKQKFEYAGAAGGFLDKNGFPFCQGRIFEDLENDEGQYEKTREVMWASGACMFVRSKVYHELGGLDEDFFAHMEEIDFCWRTWNAGYKVFYCHSSHIYHVGAGTLPKNSPRKTFLNFRNGLYLLHKNLPSEKLLQSILIRLLLDGLAGVKFIFHAHFMDTFAIIKAHFAYYRAIRVLREKRKQIPIHTDKVLKPYSIVWAYFFKRIKVFSNLEG